MADIATALAKTCRYGGHCKKFYSVAEHSVICADVMFEETSDSLLALCALMHDAAEAYVGDLPIGLKRLFPAYKELEHRIQAVISEKYGMPWPFPPSVKEVDRRVLVTERPQLLRVPEQENEAWIEYSHLKPYPDITLRCHHWSDAEAYFLLAFEKYYFHV